MSIDPTVEHTEQVDWETCDECGGSGFACAQCLAETYSFPAPPILPTRERVWDVISIVRDAAPRLPDDASTDDIIDALVDAGVLKLRSDHG